MLDFTISHRIRFDAFIVLLSLFILNPLNTGYSSLKAQAAHEQLMPDIEIRQKVIELARIYKLDSSELKQYDKIVTFDREVFVGRIYNVTYSDVRFYTPGDDNLSAIGKSQVSQILYADGRRDVFIALDDRVVKQSELVDTTRIVIKNQKDWMRVRVTEDPAEVSHLKPYGDIKANYEAEVGNVGKDDLMRHAGIILKKRAALLKAHYVLIDTKFFQQSYGEPPSVKVTARAFGY